MGWIWDRQSKTPPFRALGHDAPHCAVVSLVTLVFRISSSPLLFSRRSDHQGFLPWNDGFQSRKVSGSWHPDILVDPDGQMNQFVCHKSMSIYHALSWEVLTHSRFHGLHGLHGLDQTGLAREPACGAPDATSMGCGASLGLQQRLD